MRPRLLPISLLLCATVLAPARTAAADDGAIIKRHPVAPIAGTPWWSTREIEVEAPARKPKSAALVILGAILGGLGAAGAVTGSVLMAQSSPACRTLDPKGNVVYGDDGARTIHIDPNTRVIIPNYTPEKNPNALAVDVGSKTSACVAADPLREAGITTLLVSAGVAAAGLTAVLVGIQPAADESDTRARLVPTIAVGPTGGSLTWRF